VWSELKGVRLEFFRTNDREDEVSDQRESDDSDDDVFHKNWWTQTFPQAQMKAIIRPKKAKVARM
jgi:hypothetical protein